MNVDKHIQYLEQASSDQSSVTEGTLVRLVEDDTGHRVLIYSSENGMHVDLRYEGETFWATQKQMAEMFGVSKQNISKHLNKIFDDGELVEDSVVNQQLTTASDNKSYVTKLYHLNAIISVGYRVNSKQGTMFRIWATDKLFQILTKGFYLDKKRLKKP